MQKLKWSRACGWFGGVGLALGVGCSGGGTDVAPEPGPDAAADTAFEAAPPCPSGQELCGSVCATLASDPKNCGACGTACADGEVCSLGKCATSCASSLLTCDAASGDAGSAKYCANAKTDRENCGACGKTCASGEICKDGSCALDCAAGQTACSDAKCHDLLSDNAHCGSCGNACPTGHVCSAGTCALSCAAGLLTCTTSTGDAGADADASSGDKYCANSKTDRENCGACGTECAAGEVCNDGTCAVSCGSGLTDCSGTCRDVQTDNLNCGACGTSCGAGTACMAGACKPTCAAGLVECGGTCVDPKTSPAHCGATAGCGVSGTGSAGAACTFEESCVGGTCLPIALPVTSGLAARFSARDAASIVTSTPGVVTGWKDLSGNGRDLAEGAAPALVESCINTRPCIDFSGGKGLKTAAFPLTTEVTVFVVAQWRTTNAWGSIAHHGSRDGDWALENNYYKSPSVTHFQSSNDNAGVELTLATGSNYVLTGRITGSTRYYSATSASAGTVSTSGTGVSISAGTKVLYVGRSELNEASNAYIGEVLYYNRPLSDVERDKVIAYLRAMWGI